MLEGFLFFSENMLNLSFLYGAFMMAFSIVAIMSPQCSSRGQFLSGVIKILVLTLVYSLLTMLMVGLQTALFGFGFPGKAMHLFRLLFQHGIVWVMALGYAFLFCKYDPSIRLVLVGTVIASLSLCLELIPLLLYSFDAFSHDLMAFGIYTLGILFALFIGKHHISKFGSIPLYCAVLYLLSDILIFSMVLVYQLYEILTFNSATWFAGFVFLACFGILVFTHLFLYQFCEEKEKTLQMQATAEYTKAAGEMMQVTQSNLNDLRKLRHELRNHLAYISTMVETRDYDRLEQCIADLRDDVTRSTQQQIDTGNRAVDMILNMEAAKAGSYGIPFETFLVVPPELPYRDIDLCSMIANAVNNALEYYLREGITDAPISVRIHPRNSLLYISVSNVLKGSASPQNLLLGRTAKPDKQLHGYGKKIIGAMAEKYGGFATFDVADGRFYTEIILPLTYQPENTTENERGN